MRKVSYKIAVSIVGVVLLVSLVLTGFSLSATTNFMEEDAYEIMQLEATNKALVFDKTVRRVKTAVGGMKSEVIKNFTYDPATFTEADAQVLVDQVTKSVYLAAESASGNVNAYFVLNPDLVPNATDLYQAVYLLDPNDEYLAVSNQYSLSDLGQGKSPWYDQPIALEGSYWSGAYVNPKVNQSGRILTYSKRVMVDDVLVGVVGMDLNYSYFSDVIQDMQLYTSGYAILLDEDRKVLVDLHRGTTVNDQVLGLPLTLLDQGNLDQISKGIEDLGEGVKQIFYENEMKVVGYKTMDANGFTIVIIVPEDEVFAKLARVQSIFLMITLGGLA